MCSSFLTMESNYVQQSKEYFQNKNTYEFFLKSYIFFFFCTIPFSFVEIFDVGYFQNTLSFKVSHSVFAFIPILLSYNRFRRTFIDLIRTKKVFHFLFFFLQLSYFISLFWSEVKLMGIEVLIENLLYYFFFLVFTTTLLEALNKNYNSFISFSSATGILVYFIYISLAFWFVEETFFLKEVYSNLINGNYAEIRSLQPFKDFSIQLFGKENLLVMIYNGNSCLLYTSPSPRDQRGSRMPSSA